MILAYRISQDFAKLPDELFRSVGFYKIELEGALNHTGSWNRANTALFRCLIYVGDMSGFKTAKKLLEPWDITTLRALVWMMTSQHVEIMWYISGMPPFIRKQTIQYVGYRADLNSCQESNFPSTLLSRTRGATYTNGMPSFRSGPRHPQSALLDTHKIS